jgi:hypothetical protein
VAPNTRTSEQAGIGFSFRQVYELAGIPRTTLINLTSKQVIRPDLEESTGTGHHRRFSFYNIFEASLAYSLTELGVQHYGIAQVLRYLRALAGDATGFESWSETYRGLQPSDRERLDRRLMQVSEFTLNDIIATLYDPSQQGEDDPDIQRLRQTVETMARESPNDVFGLHRKVLASLFESENLRAEADAWARFKTKETRQRFAYLIVFPRPVRSYWTLKGRKKTHVTVQRWAARFITDPTFATTAIPYAAIVLNVAAIADALEHDSGRSLEQP